MMVVVVSQYYCLLLIKSKLTPLLFSDIIERPYNPDRPDYWYLKTSKVKWKEEVHFFSNQLVSTYQDKFKCVAKLLEDGTIE